MHRFYAIYREGGSIYRMGPDAGKLSVQTSCLSFCASRRRRRLPFAKGCRAFVFVARSLALCHRRWNRFSSIQAFHDSSVQTELIQEKKIKLIFEILICGSLNKSVRQNRKRFGL